MSYHFSPKIVTDGLVYYADVVNSKTFNGTNQLRDLTKVNADNPIIVSPNSYTQSDMGYLDTRVQAFNVPLVLNGFEYGFHWDANWTQEYWFNPDFSFGPAHYKCLLNAYFGGGAYGVFHNSTIGLANLTGTYLEIGRGADTGYTIATPYLSGSFINNKWNQFTITLTDNSTLKLYHNGELKTTRAVNWKTGVGNTNCVEDIKIINDKILVAGSFHKYNNTVIGYGLTQLNDNGTINTSFNPPTFAFTVRTIDYDAEFIFPFGNYRYTTPTNIGGNPYINSAIKITLSGTISESMRTNIPIDFDQQTVYKVKKNLMNGGIYFSTDRGNRFYRLTPSLTVDTTSYSALLFNGLVLDFEFDNGNNHNYTVGSFTSYNSTTYNRLARLSLDGILDTTFNIGSGFNNTTQCIKLVTNKLYIGGDFTSFNSNSRNRIIRINTDGTIDNTFNIGSGFNSTVKCITVDQDGKLLIGGDFTTYNGVSASRIIRLNTDGTRDNTFNMGIGFDRIVNAIAIDSNNKIVVGGYFFNYNGQSYNGIIRLNTNGTIDNTFNIGIGFTRMNQRPMVTTTGLGYSWNIGSGGNIIGFASFGMSMIRFYNKALTDAEVLKNFNATRGRYGL